MDIIKIILFFIFPANLFFLFLLKLKLSKKINEQFLLLVAYGTGPLLSGLFFYYLIWFFPEKSNNFYIAIILLSWILLLFYSRSKIKEVLVAYKNIAVGMKDFPLRKYLAYFIIFLFTAIFSIQTLVYPIAENDSAWYFSQSEALHQSKNAHWYTVGPIILNGTDQYSYNKMIRPGIPSFMAFSFLFGEKESNYFIFSLFFVYYYYLLLGMLLFFVSKLAIDLNKDPALSKLLAFIFFTFYWNMTRFYIFNNKEVAIYFLALVGIYLVYELVMEKKRDIGKEVLLGAIMGLNSFINMHGILIGIFLLLVLFIFSKLSFWQRIRQAIRIFSTNLLFSAFEFVQSFGFIFLNTFRSLLGYDTAVSTLTDKVTRVTVNTNGSPKILVGDQAVEVMHAQMYQMNNLKDVYIKGKLQAITNVGSYGFYFLLFISILATKFKEIIASVFGKILLLFIAIYYLIIIDPFNLNKNDLAIVLSGSPKYSMFIVLLSIVVVSVYFDSAVQYVFKYIFRNKLLISGISFVGALFLCNLKSSVISLGLKIITELVQIDRDVSFYASKIELFYYFLLGFIIFLGIILAIFYFMEIPKSTAYKFFCIFCLFFMISPFFVVSVGKVPLHKTFSMLNESREVKLQDIIYFGDLFQVYYYAKDNLPKKTPVSTSFSELYTYNDYFQLRVPGDPAAKYEINKVCSANDKELYRSGVFALCQNKNHR